MMKYKFSISAAVFFLCALSVFSTCFLNSVDHTCVSFYRGNQESDEKIQIDKTNTDSTNVNSPSTLRESGQENYLPNVTILNYVVQKGIESLPVPRVKDFIPFFKGKKT